MNMEKLQARIKFRSKSGQSAMEYFIIISLVLAVIISSGFIGHMRDAFHGYFDAAVERMR